MGELLQFRLADTTLLQEAIRNLLQTSGSVDQRVEDSQVAPDVWRSVARAAARELGRSVRTFEFDGLLHASLLDWPANAKEDAVHRAALHRAMEGLNF